jgi:hypothetical protein
MMMDMECILIVVVVADDAHIVFTNQLQPDV